MSGDYSPPRADHNSLYLGAEPSGGVHGPAASPDQSQSLSSYMSGNYNSRLDALAARPQRQQETELEY